MLPLGLWAHVSGTKVRANGATQSSGYAKNLLFFAFFLGTFRAFA